MQKKKEAMQKNIALTNLILPIILLVLNLINAPRMAPIRYSGYLTEVLFTVLVLANIFFLVYILAKRKKSLYYMQTIFLLLTVILIIISFWTSIFNELIRNLFLAGVFFIFIIVSLYYLLKN